MVVEPFDAASFQSDYFELLGEDAAGVAANTDGVCEYLDRHRLDEAVEFDPLGTALIYYGHGHQNATKCDHHAIGVLRRAGYDVAALDSSCCGMAGSFGYEPEHYSMSTAPAGILIDQSHSERAVAPGASCRSQLASEDVTREGEPPHPVEALAGALPE